MALSVAHILVRLFVFLPEPAGQSQTVLSGGARVRKKDREERKMRKRERKRKKKYESKYEEKYISDNYMSTKIALNINGLYAPIKR